MVFISSFEEFFFSFVRRSIDDPPLSCSPSSSPSFSFSFSSSSLPLSPLTCIAIIHSGQLAPKTPMRSLGEMPRATSAEAAASTRAAASSYVIHS